MRRFALLMVVTVLTAVLIAVGVRWLFDRFGLEDHPDWRIAASLGALFVSLRMIGRVARRLERRTES